MYSFQPAFECTVMGVVPPVGQPMGRKGTTSSLVGEKGEESWCASHSGSNETQDNGLKVVLVVTALCVTTDMASQNLGHLEMDGRLLARVSEEQVRGCSTFNWC